MSWNMSQAQVEIKFNLLLISQNQSTSYEMLLLDKGACLSFLVRVVQGWGFLAGEVD